MAFTTTPVAKPSLASENNANTSAAAQSARERAIARLMGSAPQGEVPNEAKVPVQESEAVSTQDISSIAPAAASLEGQTATNEAVSESASATEKSTDEPLSPQYAVLARKEKALRAKAQAQEQAYRAKEEALAAREAALKAKETEYQSDYVPKERLKTDAWSVLNELGLTYEELTQAALNQSQVSPAQKAEMQALKAEIQALREESKKTQSSIQDQQTNAYKQAVAQIRKDATALVESDTVNYEAIHKSGSIDEVVNLIERTFKEDGVLMSIEDAATEIENYLIEESLKFAGFEKVKKKLQPQPTPPQQTKAPSAPQSQPTKTLTNGMGGTRKLSARERAILAFKGESQK